MKKMNFDKWHIAVLNAIDGIKEPKKITPAILRALNDLKTAAIVERLPWSSRHSRFQNKTEKDIFKLLEVLGNGMHTNSYEIPSLTIHITEPLKADRHFQKFRVYVNDFFQFEATRSKEGYFIRVAEHRFYSLAELWDQLKEVYNFDQSTLV